MSRRLIVRALLLRLVLVLIAGVGVDIRLRRVGVGRVARFVHALEGARTEPHVLSITMVLELAILDVIPAREADFEGAFSEARSIIASMPGFISLELHRCLEQTSRYALLVRWNTVEDHTVGFRQSVEYQRWKQLLHHFYDPFPKVEHFTPIDAWT